MLFRLAYLAVTNGLAMLRPLPMSDRAKDVEILAIRHQITVLERQLHSQGRKIRFAPTGRAFLAALLDRLPRDVLHRVRLLVRPETVLRWHRELIAARHARISRPKRSAGRAPSGRSASWSCAWRGRTARGDTDASTVSCSSWASGLPRPPYGRSSRTPESTLHHSGAARPGRRFCACTVPKP